MNERINVFMLTVIILLVLLGLIRPAVDGVVTLSHGISTAIQWWDANKDKPLRIGS